MLSDDARVGTHDIQGGGEQGNPFMPCSHWANVVVWRSAADGANLRVLGGCVVC